MGTFNFNSSSKTTPFSFPALVYTFEDYEDFLEEFYDYAIELEDSYDFLDVKVQNGYFDGIEVIVTPKDDVLNFAYSDIKDYECYKLAKELKDIHRKLTEHGAYPTTSSRSGTSEISKEFYDEIVRDFIKVFDTFRTEYIKNYNNFYINC